MLRLCFFLFAFYAFSTLSSMALMNTGKGLLLIALVFLLYRPQSIWREFLELLKDKNVKKLFLASLLLTFTCTLSVLVSKFFPVNYGGKQAEIPVIKFLSKLIYLFLPFVFYLGFKKLSSRDHQKLLQVWIITMGIVSIVGVIQYFTGWPKPQAIPLHPSGLRFHATLFLGHHLTVASILIFPFFAALDLLFQKQGPQKSGLPRWALACATLLGAVVLFLTYSRALWGALSVGLCFWAILVLPRKITPYAIVTLLLFAIGLYQVPAVKKRFTDGLGVSDRVELWTAHIDFLKERPWTGIGWRSSQELSFYYLKEKYPDRKWIFGGHAHNNLIDILGGAGILGAISWLLWCGLIIYFLIRLIRAGPEAHLFAKGLLAAWLVFHINGLTQTNFWDSKVLHQTMWVTLWMIFWLSRSKNLSGR